MHPDDISLAGKAAVVTGAGAGIGAAIARGFANFGAWVGVLDKNGPAAERVAASIRESGGEALALTADVNEPRDVAEAASRVLSERGSVDILVNNVGDFLQQVRPFLETGEDDWTALYTFRCQPAPGVPLRQGLRAVDDRLRPGRQHHHHLVDRRLSRHRDLRGLRRFQDRHRRFRTFDGDRAGSISDPRQCDRAGDYRDRAGCPRRVH